MMDTYVINAFVIISSVLVRICLIIIRIYIDLKVIRDCNKINFLPKVEGCNIVSQSVRRIM